MPGSGAYTVGIDKLFGPGLLGGVVPLPPTNNTGIVNFNPVFLSLANSGGAAVNVHVIVFRQGGANSLGTVTVPPETRVSIPDASPTAPGDLAVRITTQVPVPPDTFLTALVEYGTP